MHHLVAQAFLPVPPLPTPIVVSSGRLSRQLPETTDLAAAFRGLPFATRPKEPGTFVYTNCLDRPYDHAKRHIRSFQFEISCGGKHTHTVYFPEPVTERMAVVAAEIFLSTPLTMNPPALPPSRGNT